jgi:glycosyltransferase involved in cell wall biosynthesis
MSKIFLIGSVLPSVTFQQWLDAGEIINPSHQLFFTRLVEGISNQQAIQVLSLPPVKKTSSKRLISENIYRLGQSIFIQFPYINHRWLRPISLSFQIHRYLSKALRHSSEKITLLIDGNSRLAGLIAKRYRHHSRIQTIGIFTDSPKQISDIRPQQVRSWYRLHRHHHGYIGITKTLLNEFNRFEKPQWVLPCIVDVIEGAKQHHRPYVFFSGALYERYGVESLVHAYLQLTLSNIDLLIAGFGPVSHRIEQLSQQHRQIKFLGLLNPTLTRKYQAGAYVNVNPRPLDDRLDEVAIPSKVLDYISSGAPTLTTRHPWIESQFKESIHYIDDSSVDGIRIAMTRFLSADYGLAQTKAIKAKNLALQSFGKEKVGHDLLTWINALK